jgi:hypothetical protein
MKRYGGQAGAFTAEDLALAPGEEEADLESIMNQVFKISMDHFHRHLVRILPSFRFSQYSFLSVQTRFRILSTTGF